MSLNGKKAQQESLEAQLESAIAHSDDEQCLELMRSLGRLCPDDAEIQHRLGSVEEQLGTAEKALAAHLCSISLAPQNPLTYLYSGFCLQQMGRRDEAIEVWSLGSDLEPALLNPPHRNDPTGERLVAAATALREHFSQLHRDSSNTTTPSHKITGAIWPQTTDTPFDYQTDQQRPSLFYIPELTARPWHDLQGLRWVEHLEALSGDIVKEFSDAQNSLHAFCRPYLGVEMKLGRQFAELQGSLNWTAFDLYREGKLQSKVAQYFPVTLAALEQVPLYGMDSLPYEVFFSVLKPGQHIKPHFGLSNHSLTIHLPLIVPPGCSLTVAGQRRQWVPGRILAFDDSYIHEAINPGGEQRVVLIFSIWHPDLSKGECDAIQRSFTARARWLAARQLPL